MFKNILFMIAGAVLATLIIGGVAFAYAQTQTPPQPPFPGGQFGQGFGRGPGMMGRWANPDGSGPRFEYMHAAIAEALGMTEEELDEALASGKTIPQIAKDLGLSMEEVSSKWLLATEKALDKMVADGVITQQQADWMLERMQAKADAGFAPGFYCGQGGRGGWRGMPRGPWQPQATPNS